MEKNAITRRVFIWGGILSLVAAFGYYINYLFKLNKGGHIGAVITQNNKVIKRIDDLDKVEQPYTISVTGDYHNSILVEKGRIRFEKSDCPNQICVHTGWLTKYGDIAVCMPNKAIVSIEKG